ncbi:MAG: hypothetical protein OEM16_00195 [Myxococcales bacterium]|nr:hypothetical protein [Myxococcales bacterium]
MAGESSDRRVMIAILLTSTLLTMLGIAGVLMGTYDLQSGPLPEDLQDLGQLKLQFLEAQATNPYRRPMAAANIVVSGLVLIGSFMLSWRRKLAQWWIRQAVTAKLIWIVAYTATLVYHLKLVFPSLPAQSPGGATLTELISNVVLGSLISAALHVAAAWRVSRPDIKAFIEGGGTN